MKVRTRSARIGAIAAVVAVVAVVAAGAQPTVVATGEGQIGSTPASPLFDRIFAPDFVPLTIDGIPLLEGNVGLGRIYEAGGLMPPPPAVSWWPTLRMPPQSRLLSTPCCS